DPIEDMLNFMTSLKSKGFTSDLLRQKHGFTNNAEINRTTGLISLHVDNAIRLSEQGLNGSAQIAFLPLYYSTLNFLKVYLLFLGKRTELERNRWHGAKYSESEMTRQFLNERIVIAERGTIPLAYRLLTGKAIPRIGVKITLEEIYSTISSIAAEYKTIANKQSNLIAHQIHLIEDPQNGHHFKLTILDNYHRANPPLARQLKAFSRIRLVQSANNSPHYVSVKMQGNFNTIKPRLLNLINRNLISDCLINSAQNNQWLTYSPVNGRAHVIPEELSILIAYFHLSNVIRYNPEHLDKLMDSKYWAIILGLRKHGFLRFLKLTWGNINKTSFDIEK
ncbi:MAG: YaaC family protein, partial [Bacteroidia bacterium]